MKTCLCCQKELVGTYQKKYCSSSCAQQINNKRPRKRMKPTGSCKKCKTPIPNQRKFCNACWQNHKMNHLDMREIDLNATTMKDLKKLFKDHPSHKAHHKSRKISNAIYKASDKQQCCAICGYDLHFEVAHIVPVSSFSDDTPLSIIHALDNLIALCRNHHWEYDHGHIDLSLYL